MAVTLEESFREAAGRVIGALAARFRDLDLAEDAFSDACVAAAATWSRSGAPNDGTAWLYRVALRRALDEIRRRQVRLRLTPDAPDLPMDFEAHALGDDKAIPDERLRLIFVCCHPAIAPDARVALTLRLVCGLEAREIAAAFFLPLPTLLQRLARAKRKIAQAGVPFAVPGPVDWPERLDSVMTTLEIAYAKAHEDAAGTSAHAGFGPEMLRITTALAALLPREGEVLGLAALVHYAEARRPARLDAKGVMIPLSEQDPKLWRRSLIVAGDAYLYRAGNEGAYGPRALMAVVHGLWCARRSLADPVPWSDVLRLYDIMLAERKDPVVSLNRAVALAEVQGPEIALTEVDRLEELGAVNYYAWHAVRADLLRRASRISESRVAYDQAIAFAPGRAEQAWLFSRRP